MDARQERGLVIAATSKIEQNKLGWKVPSQSGNGTYIVNLDHGEPFCTCPDFEKRQQKRAKYWGNFRVQKIARLEKPVVCYSDEIGEALFEPTLVKIQWDKVPSDDKHEFWLPYWISIKGKERYGQFAPMLGEASLLELLCGAIKQGFFSDNFLRQLDEVIREELTSTY